MSSDDHSVEECALCPHCALPLDNARLFCGSCGCPLTFAAAAMPYERILAQGFIWREGSRRPNRLIILVGMCLLCGIPFLSGSVALCGLLFRNATGPIAPLSSVLSMAFYSVNVLAFGFLLKKTVRNYIKLRQDAKTADEEGEAEMGDSAD